MPEKFAVRHKEHFSYASIVFDHFHVIKMMNYVLNRILGKEAMNKNILKHKRYDWLKNFSDLLEMEGSPYVSEIS